MRISLFIATISFLADSINRGASRFSSFIEERILYSVLASKTHASNLLRSVGLWVGIYRPCWTASIVHNSCAYWLPRLHILCKTGKVSLHYTCQFLRIHFSKPNYFGNLVNLHNCFSVVKKYFATDLQITQFSQQLCPINSGVKGANFLHGFLRVCFLVSV